MSADLHRYGFTAKGASCVFYAKAADFADQGYTFTDWPRGTYATQTFVGTRAGGAIAAAWAVMLYLGVQGYFDATRRVIATRRAFEAAALSQGLKVYGQPELGIVAFGSPEVDMLAVAERMEARGWQVGKLQEPRGLHMMLNLTHEPIVAEFEADLAEALAEVSRGGLVSASASTY